MDGNGHISNTIGILEKIFGKNLDNTIFYIVLRVEPLTIGITICVIDLSQVSRVKKGKSMTHIVISIVGGSNLNTL